MTRCRGFSTFVKKILFLKSLDLNLLVVSLLFTPKERQLLRVRLM